MGTRSVVRGDPNLGRGTDRLWPLKKGRCRLVWQCGFLEFAIYHAVHRTGKQSQCLFMQKDQRPRCCPSRCRCQDHDIHPACERFVPFCAFPSSPQWLRNRWWRCEYAQTKLMVSYYVLLRRTFSIRVSTSPHLKNWEIDGFPAFFSVVEWISRSSLRTIIRSIFQHFRVRCSIGTQILRGWVFTRHSTLPVSIRRWMYWVQKHQHSQRNGGFATSNLTSPLSIAPRLEQRFLQVSKSALANCFEKKHSHSPHMTEFSCEIPCPAAPLGVSWRREGPTLLECYLTGRVDCSNKLDVSGWCCEVGLISNRKPNWANL